MKEITLQIKDTQMLELKREITILHSIMKWREDTERKCQ